MTNTTQSVEPIQQLLNNALQEYKTTAAQYGHYSAKAIIAKLKWQSLEKSFSATSSKVAYQQR